MGGLETEVLMCLWSSDGPLSPSEVRAAVGEELAYSTVVTVLGRLWRKGLVEREAVGRGFVYRPLLSEAELVAERMHRHLTRARDHEGVLAQFVSGLSRSEIRALGRLMDRRGKRR
jgi:predicted transcriptional regulator